MFGLPLPLLVGAGVAFALILAGLGIQTARLDAAIKAMAALEVQLEDAGRKIEAQNLAVDKWAQSAELAKAEKDKALVAAAGEVRFHQSRADALRPRVAAPGAPAARTPGTPPGREIAQPAPAGERTAAAAVLEFRKRLKP